MRHVTLIVLALIALLMVAAVVDARPAKAQEIDPSKRLLAAIETLAQGAVVDAQTLRQIDERLKFLVLAEQGQTCLMANAQRRSWWAVVREVGERAWEGHNCEAFYAALLGEKGT